jgi:hypothetical protein
LFYCFLCNIQFSKSLSVCQPLLLLRCDDCISINDRLRVAKTKAEKEKLWKLKKLHIYLVKEERFDYAQRILLSEEAPRAVPAPDR